MGQNLCLFEIHLSQLLSLRSLQGTRTLPSLSGFGVREDGRSSSLHRREIFIFLLLSFFILFYFNLPHATSQHGCISIAPCSDVFIAGTMEDNSLLGETTSRFPPRTMPLLQHCLVSPPLVSSPQARVSSGIKVV